MPGIKDYKEAYQSAVSTRGAEIGADEKDIRSRIEKAIQAKEVPVLFCRDNGIGIDPQTIKALLWEGNTTKLGAEGGSFGVGHMFPFRASDLRYVMYAGRYYQENKNDIGEIAVGHAMLAGHEQEGNWAAPDGFWVERLSCEVGKENSYSRTIPELFNSQIEPMRKMKQSGTVVAVLGFNNFYHEEGSDFMVDLILEAAAKNFYPAICSKQMTVSCSCGKDIKRLDAYTIKEILRKNSGKGTSDIPGFLSPRKAWESYKTLTTEKPVPNYDQADIYVRSLDTSQAIAKRHEVIIARSGMYITRDIPYCRGRDFTGTLPFNALVIPKPGSELETLLRASEGPEHRDINAHKKLERTRSRKFLAMLSDIKDIIKKEAGEEEAEEEWESSSFAILEKGQKLTARRTPRLSSSPRHPKSTHSRTNSGNRNTAHKEGKGKERPKGNPLQTSVSMRSLNQNGETQEIAVVSEFRDNGTPIPDYVSISITTETGSDQSCQQPVYPTYLVLEKIVLGGDDHVASFGSEIVVPTSGGTLLDMSIVLQNKIKAEEAAGLRLEMRKAIQPQLPVSVAKGNSK